MGRIAGVPNKVTAQVKEKLENLIDADSAPVIAKQLIFATNYQGNLTAFDIAEFTSLPITCSPKAEVKCLILPVTNILYGSVETNDTVSPILYPHRPAFVFNIIT